MAFIEEGGKVQGYTVQLYWTLEEVISPRRVYTDGEVITDGEGNKLDIDGNIIPIEEYKNADFAYTEGKEQVETIIIFRAFPSKEERGKMLESGQGSQITKNFSFRENPDSMITPNVGSLDEMRRFYYVHPLFTPQIPEGWVSDE